ncbi:MAG TPA: acyl-CoA thioesterase [Frankiaceae bacterium]|jgi:acyl-CoA hydrolase|nr:acyl-CoA thioesterase [Frankiaceae bacterium]
MALDPRPVDASRCTLSRIMTALDANLHGNIHGGVIMKLVDDAAGVVAARHSGGRAVTASMDEMVFLVPVHVGDLVHAHAQVNWAGRTSMEIGVRVEAERWDEVGEALHTSTAYLVYVGLDARGKPREVPPVSFDADDEVAARRFREAEIRRTHRLARREAIRQSRGET